MGLFNLLRRMEEKRLANAITEAAELYSARESMKIQKEHMKIEKEILSGKRKTDCGYCGNVCKVNATCSRSIICGKYLCSSCASKCENCNKFYCPKHLLNHKCQ